MLRKFRGPMKALSALVVLICFNQPLSSQSQSNAQAGGDGANASEQPQLISTFAGGALEGVRKRVSDTNTFLTAINGPFVYLASANLAWGIPAGDSDLLNLSFTAECQLRRNGAAVSEFDWIEMRAVIFASPARAGYPLVLTPGDAGSPMAFCASQNYNMNHAAWAHRPTPVGVGTTYTVAVQWRIVDNAPISVPALTGWLDDWEIALQAYN